VTIVFASRSANLLSDRPGGRNAPAMGRAGAKSFLTKRLGIRTLQAKLIFVANLQNPL
jgi:hypothetical protein